MRADKYNHADSVGVRARKPQIKTVKIRVTPKITLKR